MIDTGTPAPELTGPSDPDNDGDNDNDTPEMIYPSLYLSGIKGLNRIPDKGHMKIKHKVIERTKTVDKHGKVHHSVHLQIRGIEPNPKNYSNSESAMKDLMDEK